MVDRLVVRRQSAEGHSSDENGEPEQAGPNGRDEASPDENDVEDRARFADSVETALKLGGGVVIVHNASADPPADTVFSERLACVYCGISLPDIEPRTFSFNSPHGACPVCTGLGTQREFDPDLIMPDRELSIDEGALRPFHREGSGGQNYLNQLVKATADFYGVPTDVPVAELHPEQLNVILYGSRKGDVITVNYREPVRPPALVRYDLRGHCAASAATLPRIDVRLRAGRARALHD